MTTTNTKLTEEAYQFINDRPESLNDDLYQWAVDAEIIIGDLCTALSAAQPPVPKRAADQRASLGNRQQKDWRDDGYSTDRSCSRNRSKGGAGMSHLLVAILALFIGYHIGWGFAHYTISKECELLGGFYVGKDVYQCAKKEQSND